MRKPKTGAPPADDHDAAPAGGRALDRARQFAQSRGLPVPDTPVAPPKIKPAAEPAPPTPLKPPRNNR